MFTVTNLWVEITCLISKMPEPLGSDTDDVVQKDRSAVDRRLATDWLFRGDQKVRLTQLK